jgi:hypothetical protein
VETQRVVCRRHIDLPGSRPGPGSATVLHPRAAARRAGGARPCRALTPLRCKHLTVRLQHASRDVIIKFIFAARTARCEGRPWYPQRAERVADCGAVPAARRIIFVKSGQCPGHSRWHWAS